MNKIKIMKIFLFSLISLFVLNLNENNFILAQNVDQEIVENDIGNEIDLVSTDNSTCNPSDLTQYCLLQPYRPSQDSEIKTSYNVEKTGLSSYIAEISRYIYIVIAIIAAFYLVYGGIQYLTTDMNSLKQEGKATIKRVLTGLIFIFSIWTIFNAINPNFLKTNIDFSAYKIPEGMGIDKTTYEAMDFTTGANPAAANGQAGSGLKSCSGSIVDIGDSYCNGGSCKICSDIKQNLTNLIDAAKKDGVNLSVYSSYRTQSSCSITSGTCAKGTSLHQLGLAVDFSGVNKNGPSTDKGYVWLQANASKYGFSNVLVSQYNKQDEYNHWSTTGR